MIEFESCNDSLRLWTPVVNKTGRSYIIVWGMFTWTELGLPKHVINWWSLYRTALWLHPFINSMYPNNDVIPCDQAQFVESWFEEYSGDFWWIVGATIFAWYEPKWAFIGCSGNVYSYARFSTYRTVANYWDGMAQHLSGSLPFTSGIDATLLCFVSLGAVLHNTRTRHLSLEIWYVSLYACIQTFQFNFSFKQDLTSLQRGDAWLK